MTIPKGIQEIEVGAFENCLDLQKISIPNSVTSIGAFAFSDCRNLQEITIPSSVETIGMGAFENCHSLRNVYIPKSVTNIGDYAFRHCRGLEYITLEGLPRIGSFAFAECCNVRNVKGLSNGIIIAEFSSFWLTQETATFDLASEIFWIDCEDDSYWSAQQFPPRRDYRYGTRRIMELKIVN